MSDVFNVSQDLAADLLAVSPEDEKTLVRKWTLIAAQIQTMLADQPTFYSIIENELKATFPHVTPSLDPAKLLISTETAPVAQDGAQWPNVLDTLLQSLCSGTPPEYNLLRASLHHADQPPSVSLNLADIQSFISRSLRLLTSFCESDTAQFWREPGIQTGTDSRKSWLLDKLRDLLKAETGLLSHDSTLTPEQVQVIDHVARYPSSGNRAALPAHSRPAVYALTLKDGTASIAFAGAWVMTARDGSATVEPSGLTTIAPKTATVEIRAQANAGTVVLYTPSGGLQGFDSLQALQTELDRRWQAVTEFESLLELLSPADLARVEALEKTTTSTLDLVFREVQESVFEYWFKVHDEQRQNNLKHALASAKTVSAAELGEHLDHVLDYVPRFQQDPALSARVAKRLARKTREWLLKASDDDRQAWFEASLQYCTQSLIANEDGEPSEHQYGDKAFLLSYARDQIQRSIQLEYGLNIDPDTVFITTTAGERGAGPVIPVSAYGTSSYTAVNSLSRTGPTIRLVSTSRTLSQLALDNIGKLDIDYALTATITTGSPQGPRLETLNASQIKHIIRTVNIGDSYQAFLKDRFIESPQAISRREAAARLLLAQMRVDALEAKISKDFSPDRLDRGYRWVEAVLNAADNPLQPAVVEGHAIKVHQLLISEATVRGVLVIFAPVSGASRPESGVSAMVLYTPEAPDGKRFREFENRGHLSSRFLNNPQMTEYLIGRVDEGARPRVATLLRAGLRGPEVRDEQIDGNFIEQVCLAEIRHALASADALSTSTNESNQLAVWNSIETAVDIVTIVLPFKVTAIIALGRSLIEMWNGFDALKRDNQREALGHFIGMIERWVDAGVDIGTAIAKLPIKGATRAASALDPKLAYTQSMEGATLLTEGAYAGIYEKAPKRGGFSQYFIYQQKHWFQVVYDKARSTWRVMDMRRPRAWYRDAIRQNSDGLWQVGTPELSLLGGGQTSLAATRVRVAFPNLSPKEAQKLLSQYLFPEATRYRMEIDLAEHLVRYKELPLWSQPYLKPGLGEAAAQARAAAAALSASEVAPQAGPLREALLSNKRKRPALDDESPVAKPAQPTPSTSTLREEGVSATFWENWGKSNLSEPFTPLSLDTPIYKVGSNPDYRVIEKDGKLFEILPRGNVVQDSQVYLTSPGRMGFTYEKLEMLIFKNKYLQPRLAEFDKGAWLIREPLLRKPIWSYISSIFPALTTESGQVLAKRLYALADPASEVLSQARMRTIAHTLHGWIFGHLIPTAVQLGDPLALLVPGQRIRSKTFHLRSRATRDWSDRIDFTLRTRDFLKLTNTNGLNEVMRGVLQRLDYFIYPDIPGFTVLVFRRKGSQTINFMQLHRVNGPVLTLATELSDAVTHMINRSPVSPLSLALTNARAQGTLSTLLGGVQDIAPFGLSQGFIYRA